MSLIAINVLLDPDTATVEKAQAVNARLREDYPDGFALDANHAPHITILQRFVQSADLEEVASAVAEVLLTEQPINFVNDKEGKPVGIHQFIGRRPTVCCGNSDGDHAMLQYTTINNPRPSFGLIVHHTDSEREYAYDAKTKSTGQLVEALKEAPSRGWVVVDMKQDWNVIFQPG